MKIIINQIRINKYKLYFTLILQLSITIITLSQSNQINSKVSCISISSCEKCMLLSILYQSNCIWNIKSNQCTSLSNDVNSTISSQLKSIDIDYKHKEILDYYRISPSYSYSKYSSYIKYIDYCSVLLILNNTYISSSNTTLTSNSTSITYSKCSNNLLLYGNIFMEGGISLILSSYNNIINYSSSLKYKYYINKLTQYEYCRWDYNIDNLKEYVVLYKTITPSQSTFQLVIMFFYNDKSIEEVNLIKEQVFYIKDRKYIETNKEIDYVSFRLLVYSEQSDINSVIELYSSVEEYIKYNTYSSNSIKNDSVKSTSSSNNVSLTDNQNERTDQISVLVIIIPTVSVIVCCIACLGIVSSCIRKYKSRIYSTHSNIDNNNQLQSEISNRISYNTGVIIEISRIRNINSIINDNPNQLLEQERIYQKNLLLLKESIENGELKGVKYTKSINFFNCDCTICLEKFENKEFVVVLHCKHIYHKTCIRKWIDKNVLKPKCPNCNYSLIDRKEEQGENEIENEDNNDNEDNVNPVFIYNI